MPSVGTAYVNIRISTSTFNQQLDALMKKLSTKMETAGTQLGKDFEKGVNKTDFNKAFQPAVSAASSAETKMSNSAKRVETSWNKTANSVSGSSSSMSRELSSAGNAAEDVARNFGTAEGSARGLSRTMSGIGRGGGGGGALRSIAGDASFFGRQLDDVAKRGESARKIMDHLFGLMAFGGNAITGLVGGLSAAAQGIFAVGANAAAAAPALSVFANGLIGIAQIGGTIGLSMAGVGNALTAGFSSLDKTATAAAGATTGLGSATTAASHAVRDAKEALQNAYQDAARSAEDASRRVADAERALATAQVATTQAQKDLNAARAEGLEQLKQIGFAAEQASLDEDSAALSLQDAYLKLKETSELPPDDRARVEAELAYKQAELNMREAKDSRQQADKDQKESVKKGVQGTDAMVSAHQKVKDAQTAQAGAERDLADARREAAQTAQDNAQKIADAQQAVADAQGRLADAGNKAAAGTTAAQTAVNNYRLALSKLSPQQRLFVTRLVGMRDAFIKARGEIADPLFKGLNDALTTVVNGNMLPRLKKQLTDTSGSLGDFASDAADLSEDPVFQDSFIRVLKSNNHNMDLWGDTVLNLADAFVQVADAARPLTRRFSIWLDDVSQSWKQTTRAKNATGELSDTFDDAGDRVSDFWDLTKQLWRTLKILGSAANDAANDFKWFDKTGAEKKGYIPSLTAALKEFNDGLKHQDLVDRFTNTLKNMNSAARAVKTLVQPLLDLGADPRVGKMFDKIAQSDAFKRMGKQAGEALPALGDIVGNVADILAAASESGSMTVFLDSLKVFSQVAKFIVDNVPAPVIKALGIAFGTWRALKFLGAGLKTITGFAVGDIRKVPGQVKAAGTGIMNQGDKIKTMGGNIAAGFELSFVEGFKEIGVQAKQQGAEIAAKLKTSAGFKQGEMIGKDFAAGVALGIEAGIAGIIEASTAAGNAAQRALKSILGIKSPSTVGMSVGRDLMSGVTIGIEEGEIGTVAAATEAGVATGTAVGAGAEVSAAGSVGRFSGILGRFSKFAGPVTKLAKPLSLGIRGIGGAFRFAMGPVGMIVLTLLPILWPLLVKLEEKTGIFSKSLGVLEDALGKVTDAFTWLWQKVIVPLFDWVKKNWPLLLGILLGPFALATVLIIKNWGKILDFIKGVPAKVKNFLNKMWAPVGDRLSDAWKRVQTIWKNVISYVKGLPAKFQTWLNKLWAPVGDKLHDAWLTVQRIWGTITTWVKGRPAQFANNLKAIWDIFHNGLTDAFTTVKDFWNNRFLPWIKGLPSDVAKGLKNIFLGLANGFVSAVNWVGGKIQKYLYDPINSVLKKFGVGAISVTYNPLGKLDSFATGGAVRGRGGPTSDSILARVSNGEYIMPTAASKKLGMQNLDYMRKYGEIPAGTGGLFGAIVDKAKDVVGAISNGAEFALKWVVGRFADQVEGHNIFGDAVVGILRNIAENITKFGHHQDEQEAATAASDSPYKGPPTGWTYAVPSGTHSYNWPGHKPSTALDIGSSVGTVLRAASGGRASIHGSALSNTSYGLYITIAHAGGWSTLYGHLSSTSIKSGQIVKPGQVIGKTGASGGVSGPHLHLEISKHLGASYYPDTRSQAVKRGLKWPYKYGGAWAEGGVIGPQSNGAGVLALLAEAGKAERVTPLDNEGFTPAEREMLRMLDESLTGGGGAGDTFNVFPAEKMDEARLADLVARRVAWRRRKGARRR